ncbi:hypothetical protein HY411_00145 [Candidatus Gottesmanbacteria bacterium]|nr:hypothetical protein [Candidatus Gottesmanbacteria bacterium]
MPGQKHPSFSWKLFAPSSHRHPIYVIQSPQSRAINVGYLQKTKGRLQFIPGRLNFGATREEDTFAATVQSLSLPQVKRILTRHKPENISTITVLRETLSCRLESALAAVGIDGHYGDAFIGASHVKDNGPIRTAYLYENTEGLTDKGLWIVADSICIGRNLIATMESLLQKFHPKEILFISPIASRRGIDGVGAVIAKKKIPTTFIAWGALFGVDKKTLYDMPWGHPDTEPLEKRDQKLMILTYGNKLCMGGDFGNNYYCPPLAKKLYMEQLSTHSIRPKIPSAASVLQRYKREEFILR